MFGDIPYLQPEQVGEIIRIPVHQAIYGGYVMYAGAEFFASDLNDPDNFAAKLADMFMFGAQMGWFSLVGVDGIEPDMAIYDKLMSSKYDAEIEYLRMLSSAKKVANSYFINGRAMRRLPLNK